MVCILLALLNITFFLMFSAHKPLQSTSWVSDHLTMSLNGVCAYVFLLSFITWMIYFTCTKFFFLGILVILFALCNLNPWNSLTGATVPGIKPHVFWCVAVIYFCNLVPSGLPTIRFSCTSLSPDCMYRGVVLIISIINFTFTKFFFVCLWFCLQSSFLRKKSQLQCTKHQVFWCFVLILNFCNLFLVSNHLMLIFIVGWLCV